MKRTHFTRRHLAVVPAPSGPRPVACAQSLDPDAVARLRKLDCRSYERCLDWAVDENLEAFACTQCKAYQPLTEEEMVRQGRAIRSAIEERD